MLETINQYKYPLMELTLLENPKVADGAPTACFVDPSKIIAVYRSLATWTNPGDNAAYIHECTTVLIEGGTHLSVREQPAEVNKLRNKALY